MNNAEFIKKYGKKELFSIMDLLYVRLSVLKFDKEIGDFKISRTKKIVSIMERNIIKKFEVAKIYYMSDDLLFTLLKGE